MQLESFPPWAQVTMSVLGFIVAAAAYFRGLFKSAPPPPKDVVVPSLTVADNAAISNMADTLREANRMARDYREHDTEMLYELKAIKESLHRLESMMGRGLDHMRGR